MTTWPQYTILALYMIGIGSALAQQKGIGFQVVASAVGAFILYQGGFWAPLGW